MALLNTRHGKDKMKRTIKKVADDLFSEVMRGEHDDKCAMGLKDEIEKRLNKALHRTNNAYDRKPGKKEIWMERKILYFKLENKKIVEAKSIEEWGEFFRSHDRIVGKTEVGIYLISTIFLGIDHNFYNEGPPLLFETMVLGTKEDEYQERFATWEEAEKGHDFAVKLVEAGKIK